jgi:undecaprenyl-diphosphatase
MNLVLLIGLVCGCVLLMIIERMGVPTTLQLSFRGDVKRETQWLAQYGQGVCTTLVSVLIYQFDPPKRQYILPLFLSVVAASMMAFLIKRIAGRARPKREHAGKFLGPILRHNNAHESFPSSHSACAVALTVVLTHLYPQTGAIIIFWTLAMITACLRYVLDAHWPSDVIGGIAVGYGTAWMILLAFGMS